MKSNRFEKNDSLLKIIIIYSFLLLFCLIDVYPILNVLSISLRPNSQLFSTSLSIIPDDWTFDNFVQAFIKYDLARWIINSIWIAFSATLVGVVLSVTAGYAFSRFRFTGHRLGLIMLLVTQMFPVTMMLLPLYLMLVRFNLANTYTGLTAIYISISIPFNVWIMKGYFDTIPKSLEESAFIDGANILSAFYKIMLPLAKPAIALSALFTFMTAWSEYIVARVILTDPSKKTLPVGLVDMQGQFTTDWGIYSAAALMTAVPIIILFISLSKYLVGGLTVGSVKG